jgi:hypothetical protein
MNIFIGNHVLKFEIRHFLYNDFWAHLGGAGGIVGPN